MHGEAGTPPGRASTVLSNRDFVKLWTGETASLIGTQVTQLALPLVAILTLHASVFQVGILNAMRYAPVIVFSLLAGVWLDGRRRKSTLVVSDLACALLIGLIPLASVLGVLSIWLLCVTAFLVGVPQVFFDIGSLSYLPSLVERRHLAEANSKMQISYSVAGIAGPSLAGLLVGILTAPIALVVDAVSYLFSLVLLLTIRRPEPSPQTDTDRHSVVSSVAEGLRAVFGSRVLQSLLLQSCTFNFSYNALITVFVVYAIRRLGLSSSELGFVIGAGAAAALVGAVFANRITTAFGLGHTLVVTTLGACLSPLLLLIPHGSSPTALLILGASQAVYSVNVVVFNITTVTLRQIMTPNRLLARMNGSYRMLLFGAGPLGAITGGALGSALGLRPALVITAIALTTPAIWILFSPVFRLKKMPSGPEDDLARACVPTAGGGAGPTTPIGPPVGEDHGTNAGRDSRRREHELLEDERSC
jgi:MFS family permease